MRRLIHHAQRIEFRDHIRDALESVVDLVGDVGADSVHFAFVRWELGSCDCLCVLPDLLSVCE